MSDDKKKPDQDNSEMEPRVEDLEVRVSELETQVETLESNVKNLGDRVYALENAEPTEPPVEPPIEPPVEPPVEPPIEPPVEPPVEPPTEPPPANTNATLQQLVDTGGAVSLPKENYTDYCTVGKPVQLTGMPTTISSQGLTISNGKAIFATRVALELSDLTIKDATVPDRNGAAVRTEPSGSLKMTNCEVTNCQNGILTAAGTPRVELVNCNFHDNGASDGYTHEIYVSAEELIVTDCDLTAGSKSCRPLKSRAKKTTVTGSHMKGSTSKNTSIVGSVVDLPNGGEVLIEDSAIESMSGTPITMLLGYAMENTNSGVGTVTLRRVTVIDGRGNGGSIESRNSGAKLVLEDCKYVGATPPKLTGWGNVTGQFAKA